MTTRSQSVRCPSLAVAITAMNSMRSIDRCVQSVIELAGIVLVIDSGSTDGTVECVAKLGAHVEHHPWSGHVRQKQHSIDRSIQLHAPTRWVLVLDSDEIVDRTLADSIASAVNTERPDINGYELNRALVFHGRVLRYTYQPEWRMRLFRAGRGRVVGALLHERIDADPPIARLDGTLLHESWIDANDMFLRGAKYAQLAAQQGGRGGSLADIMIRPGAAFLKQYLLRRGFLDGWRGLVTSTGAASSTLLKHVALAERKGRERESNDPPA